MHSKKIGISKCACKCSVPNGIFTIFDVHFGFAFTVVIETMTCLNGTNESTKEQNIPLVESKKCAQWKIE